MKILFVTSEIVPKVEQLALALDRLGIDVDIVLPDFPSNSLKGRKYKVRELEVGYKGETFPVDVVRTKLLGSNVDTFLLKNTYFNSFTEDGYSSEPYIFLSKCISEFISSSFNTYNVIHCFGLEVGIVPLLVRDSLDKDAPGIIYTPIGLPEPKYIYSEDIEDISDPSIENRIDLNTLGAVKSDFVSTWSPTFAKEILFPDIGQDMSKILHEKGDRLIGLLCAADYNDIDVHEGWTLEKRKQKKILQKLLGLDLDAERPIFTLISNDSTSQDIKFVSDVIPKIVDLGGQFIYLGTEDEKVENKLKYLSGNISINMGLKNTLLEEQILAGSDFILYPAKSSPEDMSQLFAMKRGLLPIAHATGTYKDTIRDGIDGYLFYAYSPKELGKAIRKGVETYYDKEKYERLVETAMSVSFSWDESAVNYRDFYEKVVQLTKNP